MRFLVDANLPRPWREASRLMVSSQSMWRIAGSPQRSMDSSGTPPTAELETAEDVAIFLDEYLLDTADPAAFVQALGIVARANGMTEIARAAGVSRESLYKSLSEKVTPAFEAVLKVLAAVGLRLVVTPVDEKGGST